MLETGGICIFAMKIPAMTQPYIVILLMSCIFIAPIGVSCFNAFYKGQSTKKRILFSIASVLELAGIAQTFFLWYRNTPANTIDIWYPIVGVLGLSIAWLPQKQHFMLQTKGAHVNENDSGEEKTTWKMVIYLSFVKIIFTFVFSFLLLTFSIFGTNVTQFPQHFKIGWYDWDENGIYYFVANCCSSVLGYVIGFIACTTCMQRGSFGFLLLFATPVAALLFSVKSTCVGILLDAESSSKCDLGGTLNIGVFVGAVVSLVMAYSFAFGYHIFTSQHLVKQNEAQVHVCFDFLPLEDMSSFTRLQKEKIRTGVQIDTISFYTYHNTHSKMSVILTSKIVVFCSNIFN